MKSRIASLIICLAMVASLLPQNVLLARAATSGTCGDNLTWTLSDSGVLTISGTGAMTDWSFASHAPWYSSKSSIKSAIIEDGVTSIGICAFYFCSNITSVTIGNSVTDIGERAFYNCSGLASITIPNGVTSIDEYTFSDCRSLISVTIGNSVTSIGKYAFYNCTGLTSINIPDGVTSICDYAFYNCDSLKSIIIPGSAISIGDSVFYGCDGLITTIFENGVTSIGKRIFVECNSLESVTFPDSVTSIGEDAFAVCTSLKSIYVNENNPNYCDIDGVLFSKDKTKLIQYPQGKTETSYVIPDSVISIGEDAFVSCSRLTSVTIGNGVTSIGKYAFYDCSSLTGVNIPNSVTSIGAQAFRDCSRLESVTIPNSVTSIGAYAFYNCSSLTGVNIPNSVTSIGECAFSGCSSLTSATIGNGVTSIGSFLFEYCKNLKNITIPNSVTSIGDSAFYYCWSLTSVTIPDSVTSIGSQAFYYCASLKSITIPNSVTSIGAQVFRDCSSLESVTISNSVTSIGAHTFRGCISLTSVNIPNSVTSIGGSAFYYCSSLKSVTIPNSVTSIDVRAFNRCNNLSIVYYGGNEEAWTKISIGAGNDNLTGAEIIYTPELPDKYKINGITVRNLYGTTLTAVPTNLCLASVSVTNMACNSDAILMIASYTADGQYVGLVHTPVEDLQLDETVEVTLPIDNSKGTIAQLKAFVVPSLGDFTPLGEALSFPTVPAKNIAYVLETVVRYNSATDKYYFDVAMVTENGPIVTRTIDDVCKDSGASYFDSIPKIGDKTLIKPGSIVTYKMNDEIPERIEIIGTNGGLGDPYVMEGNPVDSNGNLKNGYWKVTIGVVRSDLIGFWKYGEEMLANSTWQVDYTAQTDEHDFGVIAIDENNWIEGGEIETVSDGNTWGATDYNAIIVVEGGKITRVFSLYGNIN